MPLRSAHCSFEREEVDNPCSATLELSRDERPHHGTRTVPKCGRKGGAFQTGLPLKNVLKAQRTTTIISFIPPPHICLSLSPAILFVCCRPIWLSQTSLPDAIRSDLKALPVKFQKLLGLMVAVSVVVPPRSAKGMSHPTLVQLLSLSSKDRQEGEAACDTILYLGLTPLEEPGLSS